jgi:hypothetical protein
MIESPLIQSIGEEFARARHVRALLIVLRARFGATTPTIENGLQQITDEASLFRLTREAALCDSLLAFEDLKNQELPRSNRYRHRPRKPAE